MSPTAAFLEAGVLSLLALHVVNSVFANRREPWTQGRLHVAALVVKYAPECMYPWLMEPTAPRAKRKLPGAIMLAINLPLFALACYYGAGQGVLSRQLVSPVYIALGLAAGHVVFVLSVLMANLSCREALSHFWDCGPLWSFLADNPLVLSKVLGVSIAEELIWRVAGQTALIHLLGGTVLRTTEAAGWPPTAAAIVVIALCFAVVHKHFFKNPVMVSVEFLCFSMLLGLLYYWTGSLILVVVIHAVRNLEVSYLEWVEETEDLILTWVIFSNAEDEEAGMALLERIEGFGTGLRAAPVPSGPGVPRSPERV